MPKSENWSFSVPCLSSALNAKTFTSLSFISTYSQTIIVLKQPLVWLWHSTLGTQAHDMLIDHAKVCVLQQPWMCLCERCTHRCVAGCFVNSEPCSTHRRLQVFDDSTEVEIKPVKATKCRSLITPDHPNLEEAGSLSPLGSTAYLQLGILPFFFFIFFFLKRILWMLCFWEHKTWQHSLTHNIRHLLNAVQEYQLGIKDSGNSVNFPFFCPLSLAWQNMTLVLPPYIEIQGENWTPRNVVGMNPFWANS